MTASLSSWWGAGHHRALAADDGTAVRLAIVLGAVRTVVRVIDRSMPPMSVDWAEVDSVGDVSASYTDMRGGAIRINPKPVLDRVLSPEDAMDVCISFGMHEAGHSQESRDRYEVLLKRVPDDDVNAYMRSETIFNEDGQPTKEVPAFEPMRIASYLWNLAEDIRMEAVTARHWPGFAPYFTRLRGWLHDQFIMRNPDPVDYGESIKDHLRFAFATCRFPDVAMTVPTDADERAWWAAWQDDYLTERADAATTIRRGMEHLAEDPAASTEMAEMAAEEQQDRENGERLRDLLDRLIAQGIDGAPDVCSGPASEGLSVELSTMVRQLVRENLEEHEEIVAADGAAKPLIYVSKPEETPDSRDAYIGRPDAETEALRAALVFRASDPRWDEKLLRQGQLDDEELYRWAEGDERLFSQHVIESRPDVLLGLLVDLSGSMNGRKLGIAQRLAQLFVWGLHDQEGVETRVWGHTADVDRGGDAHIYRLWEPGDPLSRLGLIAELPHASNADGHAIAYCASQMGDEPQPQKVLIVLSDGQPSADCYGNADARAHVRAVCRWAEARGVKVLQIAIDPRDIRPTQQAEMFGAGNWIGFTDYAQLPRQLAGLMARFS